MAPGGETRRSISGKEYSEYAASNLMLWSELVGVELTYPERGTGRIVSVEQRSKYIPLIYAEFCNKKVVFNPTSFQRDGVLLLISGALAERIITWRVEQNRLAKVCAEQEGRRKQDERYKQECEYNQVMDEPLPTADKYNDPRDYSWKTEAASQIDAALKNLPSRLRPGDPLVKYLEKNGRNLPLARIFYHYFQQNGGVWDIIKTCSYLRRAGCPKGAITASNEGLLKKITSRQARSALLTTRGGAFRDLNQLDSATKLAADAIQTYPDAPHAYTLLGAILYQQGFPAEGDEQFAKAAERDYGRTPRAQQYEEDFEIRKAFDNSESYVQQKLARHLLFKDSTRYAWAKEFLDAPKRRDQP